MQKHRGILFNHLTAATCYMMADRVVQLFELAKRFPGGRVFPQPSNKLDIIINPVHL